MLKRTVRIVLIVVLVLMALSFAITRLVQRPDVQYYLVQKATTWLSNKLHTHVSVGYVDITFFKRAILKDIYIEDQRHDTLLYAGTIKADISLFSLLNKTVHLSVVSADNITLNLRRHYGEKNYNLQFVLDSLASKSKQKSNSSFSFDLKTADLKHIRINWLDEPSRTDMTIVLPSTNIDINKLDFAKPSFDVHSLQLDSPIVCYRILIAKDTTHTVQQEYPIDTSREFLGALFAKVGMLKMNGGSFYYDVLADAPSKKGFDPSHIHVNNITFSLNNANIRPDSIIADFKTFTAHEMHGFTVKQLKGHAVMTAFKAEVSHLLLVTDNSTLQDYYAMEYRSFHDFEDYVNRVYMIGRLKNSHASFKDISFFAPDIDYIKHDAYVSGEVAGTVTRLKATNVVMYTGTVTAFDGDISINGLPDVNETFFDAKARNFTTSENDIKLFYPGLNLPENFKNIGTIQYIGSYSGFYNDFVAKGELSSNEYGRIYTDVQYKINPQNNTPLYSAVVSADNINLGKFTGNTLLGNIDLNGEISGSGFNSTNDSLTFRGIIKALSINDYNYHNIAIDGHLLKKKFTGNINISDDNINLIFNGAIDMNATRPVYQFTANITNARLHALNLYKSDISVSCDAKVDGTGNNIDDALGVLHITNLAFTKPGQSLAIGAVSIIASDSNNHRRYDITLPQLKANLTGNFTPSSLGDNTLHILNKYLPALKLPEGNYTPNMDATLTLDTKYVSDIATFFAANVKGFDNSHVNATLNKDGLKINAFIPQAAYKNYIVKNNYITLQTINDSLKLYTRTSRFYFNTSSYIDSMRAYASARNNDIEYGFIAGNASAPYHLNFKAGTAINDSIYTTHINNSRITLNGQSWTIDKGNTIILTKHTLMVDKLELHDYPQSINIQTDSADAQQINVNLNDVQLGDYYNIFQFGGVKAYGYITGKVSVKDVLNKPFSWASLDVHTLQIDKDTIGDLSFQSTYDPETEKVLINNRLYGDKNNIKCTGYIYTASDKNDINLDLDVIKVDLKGASDFLKDFISNVKGTAGGRVTINGTIDKPQLEGDMVIPNAEATVKYLQTHYHFTNEKLHFTTDAIVLDDNTIYDADNNKAHLSGSITHSHLTNWGANMTIATDKFQVLNTGERDNDLYYGKAYASGTIRMNGAFDKMQMDISLRSESGTTISIPVSGEQSLTNNDFIHFVKRDTLLRKSIDSSLLTENGMLINMDLDINPRADVKIIFDKKLGDIIEGTGSGNIRMEINTAGDFKIFGQYTIENGNYLFTLPQLSTNKQFTIDKGGTILWTGNFDDAIINMTASYTRRVLLNGIVQGTPYAETGSQETMGREPVSVVMKLNGSLFTPGINFDIVLPNETQDESFGIVELRLQEIKQDVNELNKQVFGLLIFNNFLPSSGVSSVTTSTSGLATSALTSTVSEFLASQLSYLLSQISNTIELNVNYYTNTTPTDIPTSAKAQNIDAQFSKTFLNNRLKLTAGGNLDFGQSTTTQNTTANTNPFASDFVVEYQLHDNLKLGAYRRTQFDYTYETNVVRNGATISYKLEFDKWGDWNTKKRIGLIKKPDTTTATSHH